ncbi:MAG: hypothetical protein LBT35_02380, partial [Tannerella sp.]|nr:hypothetical protein [Tannerella sp.]
MNQFEPDIHHRRSVRFRDYDYAQEGFYFVTICVQNKQCLFGKIADGEMVLSAMGKVAKSEWLKTAELRQNVQLHNFVVMPNHFHAIVEIVGRGVLHTPNDNPTPNNNDAHNDNLPPINDGACNRSASNQ